MRGLVDDRAGDSARTIADLERRLAECAAERDAALAQQAAAAEILQLINASRSDLAPVFEAIVASAAKLCEAEFSAVARFDGGLLHLAAVNNLSPGEAAAFHSLFPRPPDRHFVMGRAFVDGRAVQIEDVLADPDYVPRTREVLQKATGYRSFFGVPILRDGVPIGVIGCARRRVKPFTAAQIKLIETFAAQAVIAMENARLITETREALDQQTATAEVLQAINSSPGDLAPVFDAMLDKAMRLSDSVYGHLLTYDGEFFDRVAVQGNTRMVERQSLRRRAESGITLERIVRGESVVQIADVMDTDAYRSGNLAARVMVDEGDCRTLLTVALRKEDILLGTLSVYRRGVRPFSDKQIALLQNFAAQAVIAMENARLLTETREALEQQTATAEVLQVINSSPGDLAPVFDAMLEKAHTLCGATLGFPGYL